MLGEANVLDEQILILLNTAVVEKIHVMPNTIVIELRGSTQSMNFISVLLQ